MKVSVEREAADTITETGHLATVLCQPTCHSCHPTCQHSRSRPCSTSTLSAGLTFPRTSTAGGAAALPPTTPSRPACGPSTAREPHQALRALGNRLVGILHGCLTHQHRYDEAVAWPTEQTLAA